MKYLVHALIFFSFQNVYAIGFQSGNNFKATLIQGQVSVTCEMLETTEVRTATFDCRDIVLDPLNYDYFVGPKNTLAESIELRSTKANGEVELKVDEYNGDVGLSASQYNLWIKTIFQTPLLGLGINKINYKLYDKTNKVIQSGDFQAKVERGTPRTCPNVSYTSQSASDCSSEYTVCQRYFEQLNNCR